MKTFELTISERLFALAELNGFKGSLDVMAVILDDIKQFPITDDEWEKAERIIEPNQWRWDDEKGGLKSIKLQKETVKFLTETIDKKSDDNELTLNDKAVVTLRKKLGA